MEVHQPRNHRPSPAETPGGTGTIMELPRFSRDSFHVWITWHRGVPEPPLQCWLLLLTGTALGLHLNSSDRREEAVEGCGLVSNRRALGVSRCAGGQRSQSCYPKNPGHHHFKQAILEPGSAQRQNHIELPSYSREVSTVTWAQARCQTCSPEYLRK